MSSSNPAGPYAAGNPSTSKRVPPVASGLYPAESVKNAAESIGISKLDDRVAATLAGDVEFRIHQVIEEAQKFMRHSKRLTMLPTDINHALEALNVEPLYGHLPIPSSSQPAFVPLKLAETAKKSSNKEQFYYLQDKEIDFAQLLAQKPPALTGGGVRWTAHWLAVEGVMPRVPENVAPNYRAGAATSAAVADSGTAATATTTANGTKGGSVATAAGAGGVSSAPGAANKVPLSQELQLYFSRLTRALLPNAGAESSVVESGGDPELSPAERSRLAALASLRADTGLQGLVAYLVRWIGEKISENLVHLPNLPPLLDMIHALLSNQTLFLEPYLHQLLPPLLSPLLTYPLASSPPTPSGPTASTIRAHAAEVLAVLTAEFGSVYESLIPRLTKTLLKSTELPAPAGRVEGALRGLAAIGKEGAKRGIWGVEREMSDTEGVRALGATWEAQASWSAEEKGAVAKAGVSILHLLLPVPRPTYHLPLPVARPSESFDKLSRAFGPLIGDALAEDRWLADRLLALIAGQELPAEEEAKIVDPSAFLSHPQRSSPPLPAPVPGPSAWDAPPPPSPPAAVDQGEDHLATMDDDDEDADMEEFEA